MFRGWPTWEEESRLWAAGYTCVAGIDEVGRGPLAGPVLAAAVVLPERLRGSWLDDLRDSKQLTRLARERLEPEIRAAAVGVGVGRAESWEIDTEGIVEATNVAMRRAVRGLPCPVDHLLTDAFPLSFGGLPCTPVKHGDVLSCSIAAASIVAKVARDRIMVTMDERFPGYGFARHKGYATLAHQEALDRLGPSPIHRCAFAPVRRAIEGAVNRSQRLGMEGEAHARTLVESRGYRVLTTNYRCPHGEIDIVGMDGDSVVFIEVRTRRSRGFGPPEASLTPAKRRQMIESAQHYMEATGGHGPWRIDVVAIEVDAHGAVRRASLVTNAVTADDLSSA